MEYVDADTQAAHLGQRDGVAQGVGKVNVGVEAGRILDGQRHPGRLGLRHAGRDHGAKSVRGLRPGEVTAPAGQ